MTLSQETRPSHPPDLRPDPEPGQDQAGGVAHGRDRPASDRPSSFPAPALQKPYVTAVLVLHDGAAFLPRTLDAIEAQTRPPDVLIGVDAGSRDGGLALLRRATPHILQLDRDTSFGDAVHAALTTIEGHGLTPLDPPSVPPPAGPAARQADDDPAGPVLPPQLLPPPPAEWLWLLHDDCAPAPDTLELLLDVIDRGPSIGIAGCKQVGWDDGRRLLEVGFTTSLLGARVTGVDVDDIDQGQLDHRSDVLAVATAGMLIRRDLWERLGGPDPALSHARADLDLCQRAHLSGQRVVVVPEAVVAHAAATASGRRGETGRLAWSVRDRRAAVHLRLAAAPWFLVPFLLVWLAAAAVVRAAGRVALKQPERAGGELLAFLLAIASPLAGWRARRRLRKGRVIRRRDFRRLRATGRQVLRQRRDAVAAYLRAQEEAWAESEAAGTPARPPGAPLARLGTSPDVMAAAPAGPAPGTTSPDGAGPPDGADPPDSGPLDSGPLDSGDSGGAVTTSRFLRPAFDADGQLRQAGGRAQAVRLVALVTVLAAAAGAAGLRLMLSGTGQVLGPALLPMPATAGQWWTTAASGWRPAGLGLAAPGDPLDAVLALLSWPLGGSPSTVATLLVLLSVPLSALSAWWAAGAITSARALRGWAAIAWAGAPALLFATGSGRLGPVLAHLLLPLAGLALARTLGLTGALVAGAPRGRGGAVTSSCVAGLLITVLLAASPSLTIPLALLLLAAVVAARRGRWSLAWVTLVPAVLLLPWWLAVARQPRLLVSEAGGPSGTSAELAGASSWHPALWPIDPARLGAGPVRSLAGRVATLLHPLLPAADAGAVLRGGAVVLALPLLLVGLSAVLIQPAPGRWARAGAARICWLIALAAAGLAVLLPAVDAGYGANGGTRVWPGALVSLVTACVLAAALCRLDGAAARLRLRSAGWRHLFSVMLGAVAVLMPLLMLTGWAATGWVAHPGSWVHRGSGDAVPAVAAAEADSAAATRTLVLRVDADGVHWQVYRSGGPRTGDWSAAAPLTDAVRSGSADQPLLGLIGALLSSAATDQRQALADADIGSIVLLKDSDAGASQALDTAVGLARVASTGQGLLWRVELDESGGPTRPARARILSAGGELMATLGSHGTSVTARVQPGPSGRVLVLAERTNPGWTARLDGRRLSPQMHAGWAQAFSVPAAGGYLQVGYEPAGTGTLDAVRLIVAAIALLGAVPLPIRRRRFLPPPARVRNAQGPAFPAREALAGRRARRAMDLFEGLPPARLDVRDPEAIVTHPARPVPSAVPFFGPESGEDGASDPDEADEAAPGGSGVPGEPGELDAAGHEGARDVSDVSDENDETAGAATDLPTEPLTEPAPEGQR